MTETEQRIDRRSVLSTIASVSAVGAAGCLGGDQASNGGDGGGGGGTTQQGEMPTIRHSGVTGYSELNGTLFTSDHIVNNVMKHAGSEYKQNYTQIQGTPLEVNALGAKEQDIVTMAFSSSATGIQQGAVPQGFSIVAGCLWGGWTKSEAYRDKYVVMNDSDVESISDLKGKSLAINAKGAAVDVIGRIALKNNGLNPTEDLNIQEIPFGAIPSALREGRVDSAVLIQPFGLQMQDEVRTIFDSADALENYQYLLYAAGNDFLDENGELARMWLEDYWLALQWWFDPANDEQAAEILANSLDIDTEVASQLHRGPQAYYRGADGIGQRVDAIQPAWDAMNELGFLDEQLTAEDYIDNSYLPDEAKQNLN